jgi:hypothetical protein
VVVTLFPLELELLHLISLPPQFLYPCLKTNIMCLVPLCHNSLCKIDFSWNYLNLDIYVDVKVRWTIWAWLVSGKIYAKNHPPKMHLRHVFCFVLIYFILTISHYWSFDNPMNLLWSYPLTK